MKKSLVARGITGIVASLLGVAAVGCSAEGGDYADVESTSQAVVLSPTRAASSVTFSGFLQIPNTSKTLILGGYNSAGNGTTTAVLFDPSLSSSSPDNRYLSLSAALPDALGEPDIVQISQTVSSGVVTSATFLVAGGRATRDGSAVTNTYLLTLSGTNLATAAWVKASDGLGQLGTGIVAGLHNIKPCGSGSKFIVFGGATDKGMDTWAGMTAARDIQVFSFDSVTPANSSWSSLNRNSDHTTDVQLNVARAYAQVFAVSSTQFDIAGGANNSTNKALLKVERLTVDAATCEATNEIDDDASHKKLPLIADMPHARARAASIAKSIQIDGAGTTYSFLLVGGNDNTGAPGVSAIGTPTDVMFYDPSGTTGLLAGAWNDSSKDLTQGRMFPRISDISGAGLKVTTGVIGHSSGSFEAFYNTNTPNTVETISATAAMGTGTALSTSRVGSAVSDDISGSSYAIDGFKYNSSTTPTVPNDVESF